MNSNMSFQILCMLGHICLFLIEDVSNFNSCCSVTQSCLTLCNPMDWAHQASLSFANLPELAQTHVHWVGDAIQSSHPQPSPSPLLSLFPSIRVFSNQSALHIRWPKYWSFLPMNTQDWSPLRWTGWISLQSKGLSSIFCKTTVQKHQFFSIDSFISPVFLSDSPLIFWCSVLDAYTLKIAISSWRTDPLLFCNVPLYGSCVKAGSSLLKNLPPNAGDAGSVPGLGRSPGEGNGNPLQYCGLENSKDCIIHGVAKGRTRLNDFHFTSSLLPWEIPWTEEPGRVQSMRLQKCQIQLNN